MIIVASVANVTGVAYSQNGQVENVAKCFLIVAIVVRRLDSGIDTICRRDLD